MKNLIDLHTHTVLSSHAFSTVFENINHSKKIGLKYYGVSDHSDGVAGGMHIYAVTNLHVLPKYYEGVHIFKGVEVNIVDNEGRIDVKDEKLKHTDYLIASIHTGPYKVKSTFENNTQAYLNVLDNPRVKILGHIEDERYDCDFDLICAKVSKLNKAIEINNSSLSPNNNRVGAVYRIPKLLEFCLKHQTKIIINSDAHFCLDVGNIDRVLEIIKNINFPEHLIINYHEELIKDLLEL